MAQVNAGRVRFVGRGEYNNSTQYYTFDLVNYNGNSYFAKSNTLGNLPTNTTYWQLVAEKGNTGDTGATGNGIASITKTSTTGLVDTYTITFTDGNTTTFNVENGNGIDHISLTSQSGATKVYTIYYTDGTTSEYTVQDGGVTQEVFDEEVERLKMVYNAMPKVSGEGTDLTLDNTAKCPVYDIELSPSELEQETTTQSANLFDEEKYKNATYNTNVYKNTQTNIKGGRKLYFKAELKPNKTAISNLYLCLCNNTNPNISGSESAWAIYSGIILPDITSIDQKNNKEFTEETDLYISFYPSNTSVETIFDTYNLWISTDSISYVPFVPDSPSPDYPQEIHTVSGENEVKIENKNLFTGDYSQFDNQGGTGTTYDYFKLPTNEVYTLTLIAKNNFTPASNNYIGFSVNGGSGSSYVKWAISGGSSQITKGQKITINNIRGSSDNVQFVSMYGKGENILKTFTDNFYIQLEKGTTATTYEPHQEQTYLLSLGDLEYCKIGDYEDLFFKNVVGSEYYDSTLELDKWYLKKNVGKVVLDGSESWSGGTSGAVSSNYTYVYTSTYDNLIKTLFYEAKCNKLNNLGTWMGINTQVNTDTIAIGDPGSNRIRIMILTSRLSEQTTTGFKNWLTENKPEVYYVLNIPTYTLLSDTLQTQLEAIWRANSYEGQTNVSQENNDLPFVIKLSAIRDLSGIFELIQ